MWENDKKLVSGPILAPLAKIWAPKIFFMDYTSIWCYTFLQAIIVCNFMENWRTILEKMAKNLLLDPVLAQTQAANFLFKKNGFISH